MRFEIIKRGGIDFVKMDSNVYGDNCLDSGAPKAEIHPLLKLVLNESGWFYFVNPTKEFVTEDITPKKSDYLNYISDTP